VGDNETFLLCAHRLSPIRKSWHPKFRRRQAFRIAQDKTSQLRQFLNISVPRIDGCLGASNYGD
jgi:hypothetical protein